MRRIRDVFVGVALLTAASACASNRYVSKNRGAPMHAVSFVNNCSRLTGRLYIDDEYQNKHKIDVGTRAVGSKPYTMQIAEGLHRYRIEFREVEALSIRQGTFQVRGPTRFEMC